MRNRGTFDESGIPVRLRIDSAGVPVYANLVTITQLDSAECDTIEFPAWTPAGHGGVVYNLTAWHEYRPDTNPRDDTAHSLARTRIHDVAATRTNLNARVRTGEPKTPKLFLANPGDYTERSFPATCRIDSAGTTIYSQTLTVDSVAAYGSGVVSFPDWTPGPEGAVYDVTTFLSLASDEARANDTLHTVATSSLTVMRVAIEMPLGAAGRTRPNAIYSIDSLCRALGWEDSIVCGADINTVEKLSEFTCVVTGSDGFYLETDFAQFERALLDWVRAGGGIVQLGWYVYGVASEVGPYTPMDSASAVQAAGGYNCVYSGTNVTITNPSHPVTLGVADFPVQSYGEYALGGLQPDAVSLGEYGGYSGIAVREIGAGRSVYLGPIYYGDFATYNNEGYFTDPNSALLLQQAMAWTGDGPSTGAQEPVRNARTPGPNLGRIAPNPCPGQATIEYSLGGSGRVRLSVFDLAGREVACLFSGEQAAGRYSVPWTGVDRSGARVAAGVYFVRLSGCSETRTARLTILE